MSSTSLTIEGMHCQACVARVTAAIRRVPGVSEADVSIGAATVGFDPEATSPERISEAVTAAGYAAKPGSV